MALNYKNQGNFFSQLMQSMGKLGNQQYMSQKGLDHREAIANFFKGKRKADPYSPDDYTLDPDVKGVYSPEELGYPEDDGNLVYSPLHQPKEGEKNIFGVDKSQYEDLEWPSLPNFGLIDKLREMLPNVNEKTIQNFLTTPVGEQIAQMKNKRASDQFDYERNLANETNQELLDKYSQEKINREYLKTPESQYLTPGFTSQTDVEQQLTDAMPPNDFDFGGMDEGYGQSDMPYDLSFPPPDLFDETPSPAEDYPDEFGETPVDVLDKDVYGLPWDEPNVVPREFNTIPGQFVNNHMEAGVYTPPSGPLTIPDNLIRNQEIQSQVEDLFMGGKGAGSPLDDILQQINSRGPVGQEGPPMAPYNEFEDFDATPYAEPAEEWNPFEEMGPYNSGFDNSGFDSDSLMSAIMQKESGGATKKMLADSLAREGAVGPLQQRDIFYKDVTERMGFPEYDRNNPEEAKAAGAHYIKYLMEEKGLGLPEALAAYNAGQTGARKGRGKKYAESILDTMKAKFGGSSSNEFEDFDMLEALSR